MKLKHDNKQTNATSAKLKTDALLNKMFFISSHVVSIGARLDQSLVGSEFHCF